MSTKLIDQFAQNLNEMIDADGIDDTANAAPGPEETAPERAETAAGEGASTESAEPTVRKIDGPAAEAIDLMEMGGSSIAKRAAPAIAALLIILFLLGRRRS